MPCTAERLRRSQKQPQQQDPVPGRQLQREGRDLVACGDIARFPCCSLIRSSEARPHCGHQQKCRYPQREKKLSKTQGDCKCGSGSGHSEGLQSRIVADAKHFKKHFVWSFSSKIPTYWSQHNVFDLSAGSASIILNSGEKNVALWKDFPAPQPFEEHHLAYSDP